MKFLLNLAGASAFGGFSHIPNELVERAKMNLKQAYMPDLEQSQAYCADFYEKRGGDPANTSLEYVANGAQGVIYRCSTTDTVQDVPSQAAFKVYFDTSSLNVTELELIDTQLTEQGARYPVYEWIHGVGKFEEFLDDKQSMPGDWDNWNTEIFSKIFETMAHLHSSVVDGINVNRYREPYAGWWNTYHVSEHMVALRLIADIGYPVKHDEILAAMGITDGEYADEIQWIQKTLQEFYDIPGNDIPTICHNDLHNGNIMVNKDGPIDPEELIFIDFDNTYYGYRAFDMMYNMMKWGYEPSDEELMGFLQVYVDNLTGAVAGTSVETIFQEIQIHAPYVLFEQYYFYHAINLHASADLTPLRMGYEAAARNLGHEPVWNESSSASLALPSLLFLFAALFK